MPTPVQNPKTCMVLDIFHTDSSVRKSFTIALRKTSSHVTSIAVFLELPNAHLRNPDSIDSDRNVISPYHTVMVRDLRQLYLIVHLGNKLKVGRHQHK